MGTPFTMCSFKLAAGFSRTLTPEIRRFHFPVLWVFVSRVDLCRVAGTLKNEPRRGLTLNVQEVSASRSESSTKG